METKNSDTATVPVRIPGSQALPGMAFRNSSPTCRSSITFRAIMAALFNNMAANAIASSAPVVRDPVTRWIAAASLNRMGYGKL